MQYLWRDMGGAMTCPYCASDKVTCNQGMCFIAYECRDCGHQWIERPEVKDVDNN
jgi:transposase-like protein